MNIYFCGIGGVGLGPLAEIALDAGHTVQGSDQHESLMTERLTKRGIAINTKQKGAFLQATHQRTPIDWFVYTAGLPADHPELQLAKMLGIKTSKRDELLSEIIKEKQLKLIAIAGTHGKTTTTAMTVWTMQQLGVPVSYSVGTTMSFGPSGHYEPGSEYFVYECDEFDRNFLHFQPHLSLITSIDFDHPDTYGSPEDYVEAFRQFMSQSEGTIAWQNDINLTGHVLGTWILTPDDVINVPLPGEHNRRNATLVAKAMERLEINGDSIAALSSFPGVDRRFEKLVPNLYSDYGHHPIEIAATLQLAKEVNNDVVLVYQPHQNIRQHELRMQYTDCFEAASDVYWLPTYLTREDPELAILTPEELTEYVTNRDAIHYAEFGDALWETIQRARDRGALVLMMGAGTIDQWVRDQLSIKQYANVILVDGAGNFILQRRDDKPDIYNPGGIDIFGGGVEATDQSLQQAATRELHEETNLTFDAHDLDYFRMYHLKDTDAGELYVTYYVLSGVDASALEIYEGQGYVTIGPNDLGQHSLPIFVRSVITEYIHPAMI